VKKAFFLIGVIIAISFSSCTSRSEEAADYNKLVIDEQIEIVRSFNEVDSTLNELDAESIDDAYHILRGKIKGGIRKLDSIGDFKGDPSLLQASKELFRGYDNLVAGPYQDLIKLLELPDSMFTSEEQLKAFKLEDEIVENIHSLHDAYEAKQLEFGAKYNLVLE
jgi:hypothetical protein